MAKDYSFTPMLKKNINFVFLQSLLFIFQCVVSPSEAFPQNNDPIRFSRISLEQGLSQSVVFQTIQDNDGYLWFGTQDGLNKYDGYKFTVYQNIPNDPNSLSNNFILCILEDTTGDLWIGTRGGGLNHFKKNNNCFFAYQNLPDDLSSLSNNSINCLYKDTQGQLWIGTNGGGLNKLDAASGKFSHYQNNNKFPRHNIVYSIAGDSSGNLWIGTPEGIVYFDPKKETSIYFSYPLQVRCFYPERKDFLWIGTDSGLFKMDVSTGQTEAFNTASANENDLSGQSIYSILPDANNQLWIATFGGGLYLLNPKTKKFIPYKNDPFKAESLSSNYLRSLFIDKSKTLWIGTYGGGLSSLNPYRNKFNVLKNDPANPNSLSSNAIRSVLTASDGICWIGTRGGGLNRFDPKKNLFKSYTLNQTNKNSISNNRVYALLHDSKGNLWIGTYGGGLNKMNVANEKFEQVKLETKNGSVFSENIICIAEDAKNQIWIGTDENGLYNLNPTTGHVKAFQARVANSQSISDNSILCIYCHPNGNIWVGTRHGGLNILDPETNKILICRHSSSDLQSISNNTVLSIVQDKYDKIWIGTDGGGINYLASNSAKIFNTPVVFKHFSIADGLPNNCIYGIVNDKNNNFWLSTNNGICKFMPYDENTNGVLTKNPRVKNYNFNDGLPSNEFNSNAYSQDNNGTIYFGSIAGLVYFHPDKIADNPFEPDISLTGFQIFNKEVETFQNCSGDPKTTYSHVLLKNKRYYLPAAISEIDEICLSHKEKVFTFEFAALDYTIPEKNNYAYKMEGFDSDWNYTGTRRHATYTNLPHGEYTFLIKAANCDGLWSNKIKSIRIVILPPFWKTFWFRFSLATIIILLIYLFIKHREKKLQKDKALLETTVKERTLQLNLANKELNDQNDEISAQRDNLQVYIEELKQKNDEIQAQDDEIQKQSKLLEIKNKNITSSIEYAESIQKSILPELSTIQSVFKESFVIYKPKDIVSGDFYWFYDTPDKTFFAVIDCTGHGVPGALLSIMGFAFLRKALHETTNLSPADILNHLSSELNTTLRKQDKKTNVRDGMDLAICALHKKSLQLEYAGVHIPALVLSNHEIVKLKPDSHPVGDAFTEQFKKYSNTTTQLQNGDTLYLFTDGITDQFGGPKSQKFSYKQLESIILTHAESSLPLQKTAIETALQQWKNTQLKSFEQTDDITVLGIKI